jgi:hypothetical protein
MAQKKLIAKFLFFIFFFSIAQAFAAGPQTYGPITFTLPDGWNCQIEDSNFICLNGSSTETQKNAAIVANFKGRSPEDSLTVYKDQLARPRQLQNGELTTPSEPRGASDVQIGGLPWVEGVHFSSEVADYYTHYFATVTGPYAVLISMSIYKDAYQTLLPQLRAALMTTTINASYVQPGKTSPIIDTTHSAAASADDGTGFATSGQQLQAAHRITIMGVSLPRLYVYLGGALLVVLALLGYALMSD